MVVEERQTGCEQKDAHNGEGLCGVSIQDGKS